MKRTLFFGVLVGVAACAVVDCVKGQVGSATGIAGGVVKPFTFSTASAFPPSMPGDIQIATFTSTRVTLSWSASIPARPTRIIDHYDILRNGVTIAQTPGTQLAVDYHPTGTALEFFSVRAIDSKGIASVAGAEILAPRAEGLDVASITIESKTVDAERDLVGIKGLLSDKHYRKGTYTYHLDRTFYNFQYSSTTTRDDRDFVATYSPETNQWTSLSVTGNFYSEFIDNINPSPPPIRGTWALASGNPLAAELRAPDGTLIEGGYSFVDFTGNFWDPSSGFGLPDGAATSDTDGRFTGDSLVWTVHLEEEITGQDFQAELEADYALGAGLLPTVDWNSRINVSYGKAQTITGEIGGGFFGLASRNNSVRIGSQYRLRIPGTGTKTVRWVEVTSYDGGSDSTAVVREETIDLDQSNGYSRVYMISPPDMTGSTDVRILSVNVSVVTPSLTMINSASPRLFLANAVFAGEAAEVTFATGSGWFIGDGTNTAVVTYGESDGFIRLVAVNPEVEAGEGLEAAINAGYGIASGTDLLADPNWPGFPNLGGWKLVAIGLKAGIAAVHVALSTAFDRSPTAQTFVLTVCPEFNIAVDSNRDGLIKLASDDAPDQTSADMPLRFWLNDDIDRGHTVDGTDYEQDDISSTEAAANNWVEDWKYNTVQSRRDLEDFARILVSTSGLSDAFKNSDLYLGLKWADTVGTPSIKLYKQYDATGGTSYLTDDYQASVQLSENAILNQRYPGDDVASPSAHTVVTPGDLFVLPQGLWIGLTGDTLKRSLLFEGCTAGKGQLKLVILKRDGSNYTEIGDGPGVWIDLKKIGDMYEHWSVGNGSGSTPDAVAARVASETGSGFAFSYTASSPEEQKYILFVHGWNMEKWEKERFAETAYKRLYWQGYKGRFGLFSWPTTNGFTTDWDAISDSTNFDRGEFTAWRSATPLRQLLQTLNSAYDGELYVLSHSMGGIVTSEAFRLQSDANGAQIAKVYVASQAALSAHAYDGTLSDALGSPNVLQWEYDHPRPEIPNANYGPQTPNIYKNWTAFVLHGSAVTSPTVGSLVNFYNENDFALSAPVWQFNQITRPDFADFPDWLWEYYYVGDFTGAPASDGFRKAGKYTNLSGEVILRLGNRTALQDRYEIMSFADESRVKAFGATPNIAQGISGAVDLQTIWPADSGDHKAHKWHSGEFRSTIQSQRNYWKTLLSRDAFNIPTTTLP